MAKLLIKVDGMTCMICSEPQKVEDIIFVDCGATVRICKSCSPTLDELLLNGDLDILPKDSYLRKNAVVHKIEEV